MKKHIEKLKIFHDKYQNEFKDIFGINLSEYWDNITGFDIVKFDEEFLKGPDRISCSDFIKNEYGEDARQFVLKLITK